MGLWSRLVERVAADTINSLVDVKLREALPAGLVDQDDPLWRRISRRHYDEDSFVQDVSQQQILKLYAANPLAKWCLEMTRDLLCAEGIEVTSEKDDVKEVIDAFWQHDINLMDINLPNAILELALFGEQCWPAFVPASGAGIVSLGLITSDMIKSVVHDPGNCALPIGVILKDVSGQDGQKLRIIYNKDDAELFTPAVQDIRRHEFNGGECFWFKINTVRASTRGLSDLFTLSDWLDGYEELLFNLRDRDADLRAFAWDVTLAGMDQAQINAWLSATEKPRPGSWFAHNEQITLEAKTPAFHAMDTTIHSRLYRNHIIGSLGFPEHWMGGGGDVNRATASEMHTPTFKRYLSRQRYVRYMIEHLVRYQLRVAAEGGMISGDDIDAFKVEMPQLATEDITKIAASLQQVTASCAQAVDLGWIEPDTAQRLFATVAGRLGVEVPQDGVKAKEQAQVTPEYRDAPPPGEEAEAEKPQGTESTEAEPYRAYHDWD